MTPAPKFSMTTSLAAARRRNTARPSSVPISTATPSRPRENDAYIGVFVAPEGSTASVGAVVERLRPDVRRSRPRFDLHHFGPERSEDLRGEVAGDELAQGEHPHAVERTPRPLDVAATLAPRDLLRHLGAERGAVFVEQRCGSGRREERRNGPHRRSGRAERSGLGSSEVDEEVARRELLVGDELRGCVQEPDRKTDPLAAVEELVAAQRREEGRDDLAHTVEDELTRRHVGQRRLGQLRRVVEQLEERLPVLHLVRGDVEEAVAALPHARRRDPDRDRAAAGSEALEVVRLPQHLVVLLDLLRGDVDELAADLVADAERGEDRHRRVRGRDVPVQVRRERDGRRPGGAGVATSLRSVRMR